VCIGCVRQDNVGHKKEKQCHNFDDFVVSFSVDVDDLEVHQDNWVTRCRRRLRTPCLRRMDGGKKKSSAINRNYYCSGSGYYLAFIGVRCFRSTSLKDVYLLDVGGKAVETLVAFTLDTIMFKGEVDFHKCTADHAIDVVRFNKVAIEVGSQGLDVMCTFNFA